MRLRASAAQLISLVESPARFTRAEPRLVEAEWLRPGLQPGAQARVRISIPFRLAAVRAAVTDDVVVVVIDAWEPPSRFVLLLSSSQVAGRVLVHLADVDQSATDVRVSAEVWLRSARTRRLLRPLRPLLNIALDRAVGRGLRRADRHVCPQSQG